MSLHGSRTLGAVLVKSGLLKAAHLAELHERETRTGRRLAALVIESGLLSEQDLTSFIADHYQVPRFDPQALAVDPAVACRIPRDAACRQNIIAVAEANGTVLLAMSDPFDLEAIDYAAALTGKEISPMVAEMSVIDRLHERAYGASVGGRPIKTAPGYSAVQLVERLIEMAIRREASDIHLEPGNDGLRARIRLDGILHDCPLPPNPGIDPVISRIKILAGLDIAEKRLPQDGNIQWSGSGGEASLRVSTLSTVRGEKAVIRLLGRNRVLMGLDELDFCPDSYCMLQRLLLNRQGLLLVAGPTGCGKTTTLYAALNYLNRPGENIVTVEDPVEYRLEGINQVQVNRRIDRSFATALPSILRQDPDIIMVGEIRDLETARITIQAGLTGHLVLSTLHTNNAAGTITRLIDMGMEEYLVSASLVGVIAQRLVRRVCPCCCEEYRPDENETLFFRSIFKREPPEQLRRGRGCDYCSKSGYRGRVPIRELMVIDRELQGLILRKAPAEALHERAVSLGMRPMLRDGLRRVELGETTLVEIVRIALGSFLDASPAARRQHLELLQQNDGLVQGQSPRGKNGDGIAEGGR